MRWLWAGRMGRILPALGTNRIVGFVEYRPLTNGEKKMEIFTKELSKVTPVNIPPTALPSGN